MQGLHITVKIIEPKISFSTPLTNIEDYIELGYDVLLFNYQGVNKSQGMATCPGLILDGESAYQYVHHQLKIPEQQITLLGHSIGGGIATEIAGIHPNVRLINDRSFYSLEDVVKHMIGKKFFWKSKIASKLLIVIGWQLN